MGVMLLVNSTTTGTTQGYYMLKEVTQASMIDAVDYTYYRLFGDIKMSEGKFMESFVRRFSENTNLTKNYNVEFFDIIEVPPKVSVRISSATRGFNIGQTYDNSFDLVDNIDAILQFGTESTNNDGSSNSGSTCYIDFKRDFSQYIMAIYRNRKYNNTSLAVSKDELRANYNSLYTWAENTAKKSYSSGLSSSDLKNITQQANNELTIALKNTFPSLYDVQKLKNVDATISMMQSDKLLKEAMNLKVLCYHDGKNIESCNW